ncbi:MAG: dihydrolipoyl dehydrogenase [Chromatiaceae bacterium]|nr:dihydrolipoyl dehydrogenase [Chromatiaceae bacterium]
MSNKIEVRAPAIGGRVAVVEVLVAPGDPVLKDQALVTLQGDKGAVGVAAPASGTLARIQVQAGDGVAEGDLLLVLNAEAAGETAATEIATEVVVLGAGPGGYTAAFRAADLGKQVILIERYPSLGGVCLNVGCIPSKALLHAAQIINEAAEMAHLGVRFGEPDIDLDKLRAGKDKVVQKLTGGLAGLAKVRNVRVIQGSGRFEAPNRIAVETREGSVRISFDQAIIAVGSTPVRIPGFPHEDPRVMDSTDALTLPDIPARLLVVGGGIIGLEMATVYQALGSRIDIVELQDQLIPGCDKDLVKPLEKVINKRYERIMLGTKVTAMSATAEGIKVGFEGPDAPAEDVYDRVLVAVGRRPNGKLIGAEAAGVSVDERGFIPVDQHMRTNVPNIFAIGDVVGNPMLAHKATHEAKVAAEVIAGLPALFDPLTIPSVAYTDPEVAWMGLTENEAKAKGIAYEKGAFPWAASGRALGIGRDEGLTKLLFDPTTKRILGAGIVGPNAGELIGETVLALEMGADYEDIGLTIHPHPTLNETIGLAAEVAHGSITDLPPPRRR